MRRLSLAVTCAAVLALAAGCATPEPQELAVGDCLLVSQVGDVAGDVPVVDCAEPHEAEVYAVVAPESFDSVTEYNEEQVVALTEEACVALFDDAVGEPYRSSRLDVFYTYPFAERWESGDRDVVCAVWAPAESTGRPQLFEGTLVEESAA